MSAALEIQLKSIVTLLEKQNEMLESIVAAELAGLQANEMMIQALSGQNKKASTDPFMRQRLLGGEGGRREGR